MSEWREMFNADVLTLGMAADEVRRTGLATRRVTYLRVHDAAPGGEIPEGAAEVRLHVAPEAFEDAVARVRAIKAVAADRRIAAYSYADLAERGWSTPTHLQALRAAGLDDVAELPADRVPDLDGALAALIAAGMNPQRVTISHPVPNDRADLLDRVQRTFAHHPSLRRFSPLPRVAPIDKPTTGYDDVRMVAMARLALPQCSIEVDWQLYGPKLAQVALTFGADHLDAVSAFDDASLGRRRGTVEDVERNIKAAGFEPQEYRPSR